MSSGPSSRRGADRVAGGSPSCTVGRTRNDRARNFVLRWSRLKRELENERRPNPLRAPRRPTLWDNRGWRGWPGVAWCVRRPAELRSAACHRLSDHRGTDIRSFLRSEVPVTLTRAAWRGFASETAIATIGIAENQWDFTDPTAIPGFPLAEEGRYAEPFAGAWQARQGLRRPRTCLCPPMKRCRQAEPRHPVDIGPASVAYCRQFRLMPTCPVRRTKEAK
jgi:hypothetical protein